MEAGLHLNAGKCPALDYRCIHLHQVPGNHMTNLHKLTKENGNCIYSIEVMTSVDSLHSSVQVFVAAPHYHLIQLIVV